MWIGICNLVSTLNTVQYYVILDTGSQSKQVLIFTHMHTLTNTCGQQLRFESTQPRFDSQPRQKQSGSFYHLMPLFT